MKPFDLEKAKAGAEAMKGIDAPAEQKQNVIFECINGAIAATIEAVGKARKILAITTTSATAIPREIFSIDMLQNLVWLSKNRDNIELERTESGAIVVRENGKALTLREFFKILGKII